MNAQELHALAPLGAYVTFSDGTPRPPDRFKNKLRSWKVKNGSGRFVTVRDDGFYLQTLDSSVLVINSYFDLASDRAFEVTAPKPGTILAWSMLGGTIDVRHVWSTMEVARHWAESSRANYKFDKCGYRYFIVADDGALVEAKHVTDTEIAP